MRVSVLDRLLKTVAQPDLYIGAQPAEENGPDGVCELPGRYNDGEQISLMPTPYTGRPFMHRHKDIEISYLLSGHVAMELENQQFQMEPDDFLILDRNCAHMPHIINPSTLLISINIQPDFFNEIFFSRFYGSDDITTFFAKVVYSGKDSRQYLYFRTTGVPAFRNAIERMLDEYYEPDVCSRELIESQLMIFLADTIRLYTHDPKRFVLHKSAQALPQLRNVIHYINEHIQKVTRADVAREYGYSYSYINQIIQQTAGCSFTELRKLLRVQHAEKLLATTSLPVAEICALSGFGSVSSFYQVFRAQYGQTPQEYRGQLANQP